MKNDIRVVARKTRKALFGSRVSGVGGFVDDLKSQWDQAIANFQQTRVDLDTADASLDSVWSKAKDDEADLSEWEKLKSRVLLSKDAMDGVASAVTTVSDWWSRITSSLGLSGSKGIAGSLGIIIPAFPISIGALLAIIATGAAVISSVSAFVTYINTKRDRVSQLIEAGVDPVQAVQTATQEAVQTSGYSFSATIQKSIMWLAVGAAAVFVLPKLLDKRK